MKQKQKHIQSEQHQLRTAVLKQLWLYLLFLLYLLILLRIVLFKQAPLYRLTAVIGSGMRAVNLIPLGSVWEMIQSGVSVSRLLENVLGNVFLFLPLGMLLPFLLPDRKPRTFILCGAFLSLVIELLQYLLALGSTDVDDLLLNTLGTLIGYGCCILVRKRTKSAAASLTFTLISITVLGTAGMSALFVTHTELFLVAPKTVSVENRQLVEDFIETPSDLSGTFVSFEAPLLTIEKSVQNAQEPRTRLELTLNENSRIYLCTTEIDYFFHTISEEREHYEQIAYSDFISKTALTLSRDNNLRLWSSDGKTIESMIIIQWANLK